MCLCLTQNGFSFAFFYVHPRDAIYVNNTNADQNLTIAPAIHTMRLFFTNDFFLIETFNIKHAREIFFSVKKIIK